VNYKILISLILVCLCSSSCGIKNDVNNTRREHPHLTKPGSTYQDTLLVTNASAIFYQPDSIQLEKIRTVTDERIFKGSMHEFFYQQRNAHLFLKQYWPQLRIIEAKNIRYLQFIKADKHSEIIDLDKKNDAYGMFLFDPAKSALLIDMTNIETQVPDYFKRD
jgi:hypothetical protein